MAISLLSMFPLCAVKATTGLCCAGSCRMAPSSVPQHAAGARLKPQVHCSPVRGAPKVPTGAYIKWHDSSALDLPLISNFMLTSAAVASHYLHTTFTSTLSCREDPFPLKSTALSEEKPGQLCTMCSAPRMPATRSKQHKVTARSKSRLAKVVNTQRFYSKPTNGHNQFDVIKLLSKASGG